MVSLTSLLEQTGGAELVKQCNDRFHDVMAKTPELVEVNVEGTKEQLFWVVDRKYVMCSLTELSKAMSNVNFKAFVRFINLSFHPDKYKGGADTTQLIEAVNVRPSTEAIVGLLNLLTLQVRREESRLDSITKCDKTCEDLKNMEGVFSKKTIGVAFTDLPSTRSKISSLLQNAVATILSYDSTIKGVVVDFCQHFKPPTVPYLLSFSKTCGEPRLSDALYIVVKIVKTIHVLEKGAPSWIDTTKTLLADAYTAHAHVQPSPTETTKDLSAEVHPTPAHDLETTKDLSPEAPTKRRRVTCVTSPIRTRAQSRPRRSARLTCKV